MEKNEIRNIKKIKLINKYSTINSKVYLIKYKINNESILCLEKEIKINNNIDNLKDKLEKEIKLINSLPSNYFLKIYEYYEYPDGVFHIIIENYISDLSELIKQQINKKNYFSENIIIKIFNKILLGIKYLHDLNILHRNINPSSIVITSNKIIKISISNFFIRYLYNEDEKSITLINHNYKEYISPEMYMNIPYSFKNDIWSLGILLFHILCLKVPFNIKQLNEIQFTKKINSNLLYHKIPKHYSNNIKYLCINLLKEMAENLARSVGGVICNLEMGENPTIVLAGSVYVKGSNPTLVNEFKKYVNNFTNRDCCSIILHVPPATGAIIWALEKSLGYYPNRDLRDYINSQVEAKLKEIEG